MDDCVYNAGESDVRLRPSDRLRCGVSSMTSRRVRIACPNCTHDLHIRVEALGRKGECKHCGHRFRAQADQASDSGPDDRSGPPGSSSEERAEGLEQMVEALEREFQ